MFKIVVTLVDFYKKISLVKIELNIDKLIILIVVKILKKFIFFFEKRLTKINMILYGMIW